MSGFIHLAWDLKAHPCCRIGPYFSSFLRLSNIPVNDYGTFYLSHHQLEGIWLGATLRYREQHWSYEHHIQDSYEHMLSFLLLLVYFCDVTIVGCKPHQIIVL